MVTVFINIPYIDTSYTA